MSTLELRAIEKSFDQTHVIHGVDLQVAHGEFVVFVGPSGCGKSTLLRMIAGLEEVSAGDIWIGDRLVNQLEPAQRDIAMVFQNYALYPHMTVFDNMAYGLKIAKLSPAQIQQRVDKAAQTLELTHLMHRKPRELSGGQRQRVAMGRAIVRQPQVFLFDEPLSNLDAKLRAQTRLEIQKLHRDLGITSLFVTHDQVEAMTLAQRMLVMNGGRMEQFGTPQQVYEQPASTFVAGFIGSPPMNLLRHARGVPEGRVLGVRPEHLRLSAQIDGNGWVARVEAQEMLGAERLIYLRLGAEQMIVRTEEEAPVPSLGSEVQVVPRADRLHWFDATSGLRCDDPFTRHATASPSDATPHVDA